MIRINSPSEFLNSRHTPDLRGNLCIVLYIQNKRARHSQMIWLVSHSVAAVKDFRSLSPQRAIPWKLLILFCCHHHFVWSFVCITCLFYIPPTICISIYLQLSSASHCYHCCWLYLLMLLIFMCVLDIVFVAIRRLILNFFFVGIDWCVDDLKTGLGRRRRHFEKNQWTKHATLNLQQKRRRTCIGGYGPLSWLCSLVLVSL